VILRRRGVSLLPLLAFAVTVSIGVAVTYGFTRFRAAAEVPIVVLAAVTADVAVRRFGGSSSWPVLFGGRTRAATADRRDAA
jgi:hypothetical protein